MIMTPQADKEKKIANNLGPLFEAQIIDDEALAPPHLPIPILQALGTSPCKINPSDLSEDNLNSCWTRMHLGMEYSYACSFYYVSCSFISWSDPWNSCLGNLFCHDTLIMLACNNSRELNFEAYLDLILLCLSGFILLLSANSRPTSYAWSRISIHCVYG